MMSALAVRPPFIFLQDDQPHPADKTTAAFGSAEELRAALAALLQLQAQQQQPVPSGGAALTWPKNARVSVKSDGEGGGAKLVKFPPRDAEGSVFASLRVRGGPACKLPPPSRGALLSGGPFFREGPSFGTAPLSERRALLSGGPYK